MIAKILLDIKAVHFNPDSFFTWTSGIKSPIYCDNRQIISYPEYRKEITAKFCERIKTLKGVEVIAGTATAGIPWASWIAHELNLPMIYVRGGQKGHGLKNQIEGSFRPGQKAVVIEDLISTGKSSIEAVENLRAAKLEVLEVESIFNYGFELACKNFQQAKTSFYSLENLDSLLEYSQANHLLTERQIGIIQEWKQNTGQN